MGDKSPNTLKSPDKQGREDGEKSYSVSTKKGLVVKPHIGVKDKKSHKCVLLGDKSPNTLKSPDKEVHEDGEKSCSASTKKSLVVKPHISVKDKKSHKCVDHALKGPDKNNFLILEYIFLLRKYEINIY